MSNVSKAVVSGSGLSSAEWDIKADRLGLPMKSQGKRLADQPSRIAMFPGVTEDDVIRSKGGSQHVALIGGFAPRRCGIATFTTDLYEQLGEHHGEIRTDLYVLRAPNDDTPPDAVADLRGIIDEQDRDSYVGAAAAINASGADVAWIQHEYGIFGGENGDMVLELVDRIVAPLIVTLHTILADPSPGQRAILERLIAKASRLMVMSQQGRQLLLDHYGADASRIAIIEHGAPDRPFGRQVDQRDKMHLADRRIMMTFGLLNPGKGLETAIEALPAIVARHPDVVYRIVGATHPNLVRREGEAYRESLIALAERLGVADHVQWDDRFLEREELLDQLEACDIYLTPYPNAQQSTSGTLSYAVAFGKAVISTPYVHARELLGDGTGILVPASDAAAIAASVNDLLDTPSKLHALQARAYARGRSTIWQHFAEASANLIRQAAAPVERRAPEAMPAAVRRMTHEALCLMSDDTGIIQHGIGAIPDRRHGYCLDDNVRALMVVNRAAGMSPSTRRRLATIYASFIQYAWNEDQRVFRNFMSYDRRWLEEAGSEDSNGRALWTLGDTAANGLFPELAIWAREWFDRTASIAMQFQSPRAMAFAMLGAASMLDGGKQDMLARAILERGGAILQSLLDQRTRPDWIWFETVLSYDNPRLPEALLRAGVALANPTWIASALDALQWICAHQVGDSGMFRPIGSEGFGREHDSLPFDQQPLEAWAAIDACRAAAAIDRNPGWQAHAEIAWAWYLGRNDRGVALGDLDTGACRDGITSQGANENRGAESILAFQLAHLGMLELLDAGKDSHDAGTNGGQIRSEHTIHHPA